MNSHDRIRCHIEMITGELGKPLKTTVQIIKIQVRNMRPEDVKAIIPQETCGTTRSRICKAIAGCFHQVRDIRKEIYVAFILAEKIFGMIYNIFLTGTFKTFVHAQEFAIGRCSIGASSNCKELEQ